MSAASCVIEKLLRLFGSSKGITDKKLYAKMRRSAISFRRGSPRFLFYFGVRLEQGVYCGMHYIVFVPHEVDSAKSILYLHGSLYLDACHRIQLRFAAELARNTHCKVCVPLYPKLPITTILPCFALLNNYYVFLRKKGEVLLIGDGSGATLALALAAERQEIRTVVALSPWVSLKVGEPCRQVDSDALISASLLDRIARLWIGDASEKDVRVSPCFGAYAGKEILLFAGERELLRPDIIRFRDQKSKEGAEIIYYEGVGQQHCYPLFPTLEGREARRIIFDKMQRLLYGGR